MTYAEQHEALIADLKGKLERRDWHGVSDAACDLRVLEALNYGVGAYVNFSDSPQIESKRHGVSKR